MSIIYEETIFEIKKIIILINTIVIGRNKSGEIEFTIFSED